MAAQSKQYPLWLELIFVNRGKYMLLYGKTVNLLLLTRDQTLCHSGKSGLEAESCVIYGLIRIINPKLSKGFAK